MTTYRNTSTEVTADHTPEVVNLYAVTDATVASNAPRSGRIPCRVCGEVPAPLTWKSLNLLQFCGLVCRGCYAKLFPPAHNNPVTLS